MRKVEEIPKVDLTALTHSFQDACANKEFKNFVDGLNIKDEILMKYTSNLEDAFLECQNCSKCKSLSNCKNKVEGFCYTPISNGRIINFSYEACKKKIDELEINAYKDNLELFDINQEIKDASFKDVYKDDKARLPILKYIFMALLVPEKHI